MIDSDVGIGCIGLQLGMLKTRLIGAVQRNIGSQAKRDGRAALGGVVTADIPVSQQRIDNGVLKFVLLAPQLAHRKDMGMVEIATTKIQPEVERIIIAGRQARTRQDIVVQLFRENVRSEE